jgi:hypothetical protein
VAGGNSNVVFSGDMASVFGGYLNVAGAYESVIAGGDRNTINPGADLAAVVGGQNNRVTAIGGAAFGGVSDSVDGQYGTTVGGSANHASGNFSVICGGTANQAQDVLASIFGGVLNTASAPVSTVVGGEQNSAGADRSLVAGGFYNSTTGDSSGAGQYGVVTGGCNVSAGQACWWSTDPATLP